MKKILAIGGAVIKTAREKLRDVILAGDVEILIHNGGSIFHDFQLSIDTNLDGHSYPLTRLLESYECNREASGYLIRWLNGANAPDGSVTRLCELENIPVFMFTGLGCDFWQLFIDDWGIIAKHSKKAFDFLAKRFERRFHYICMGSAVIHPEVFLKLIAYSKAEFFRADVVDFKEMYRPKTRVAVYGSYYKMTHAEFLDKWLSDIKNSNVERKH